MGSTVALGYRLVLENAHFFTSEPKSMQHDILHANFITELQKLKNCINY